MIRTTEDAKRRGRGVLLLPLVLVLGLLAGGCQEQKTESPTKGHLKILAAESVEPIVREIADSFQVKYPEAKFEVSSVSSREAIVKLINGDATLIVVGRDFNPQEDSVIRKYNIQVSKHVVAYDGVAALVNERNPVKQLTTTDLANILEGNVTRWNAFKGGRAEPIRIVTKDPNAGTYEFVSRRLLGGRRFPAPVTVVPSSPAVVEDVAAHGNALGFVGLYALHGTMLPVRPLELSDPSVNPDTIRTVAKVFSPHPAYVYLHYYPLTRPIVLYSTEYLYGLGGGFISFIASPDGQRLFLKAGLVPATQNIRLVPASPESN